MEIISRKDAMAQGLKFYFTGKPCKRDHLSSRYVIDCSCAECKFEQRKLWHEENKVQHNKQNKMWREQNKSRFAEYSKKWKQSNPDKYRLSLENGKQKRARYKKIWAGLNRDKCREYANSRRAMKLNATPKWLTETDKKDISNMYWWANEVTRITGIPYHVDHIVPLKGKNVCGLHVPWNLDVIPAIDNLRKNNKWEDAA